MSNFIECTSVNISYDVMGLATVSYTIVSDTQSPPISSSISEGGRTFTGYVTNITQNIIPKTQWYETQVTLITTTGN